MLGCSVSDGAPSFVATSPPPPCPSRRSPPGRACPNSNRGRAPTPQTPHAGSASVRSGPPVHQGRTWVGLSLELVSPPPPMRPLAAAAVRGSWRPSRCSRRGPCSGRARPAGPRAVCGGRPRRRPSRNPCSLPQLPSPGRSRRERRNAYGSTRKAPHRSGNKRQQQKEVNTVPSRPFRRHPIPPAHVTSVQVRLTSLLKFETEKVMCRTNTRFQ